MSDPPLWLLVPGTLLFFVAGVAALVQMAFDRIYRPDPARWWATDWSGVAFVVIIAALPWLRGTLPTYGLVAVAAGLGLGRFAWYRTAASRQQRIP